MGGSAFWAGISIAVPGQDVSRQGGMTLKVTAQQVTKTG